MPELVNAIGFVFRFLLFCGLLILGVNAVSAELAEKGTCLEYVRKYNYELALQQCEYEADKGSAVAAEILGFVYLKGKSGIRDWDLSRRYFEQARNLGLKHASGFLGMIYWHGLGVKPDERKARAYFNECAELPPESGHVTCTALYARTLGTDTNSKEVRAEAVVWYGKLVQSGEYVYLYNLAVAFRNLKKWRDAYVSAEFFKMWAKRYGKLWVLRKKYQVAEEISANALSELSPNEIEELYYEVRHKINSLQFLSIDLNDPQNLSEAEKAAYFLKWQE